MADAGLVDSGVDGSTARDTSVEATPDMGPPGQEVGREVGIDARDGAADKGRDSNPGRDAGRERFFGGEDRPAIDADADRRPPAQLVVAAASPTIQAQVGLTSEVGIILQNQGDTETGQLTVSISSTTNEYTISYSSCAGTLAPQAKCYLLVAFAPKKTGKSQAVLEITDTGNPLKPAQATLEGTAYPINPGFFGPSDLGAVIAGSSGSPVTYTVSPTGSVGIELTTSDPRFVISNNTCSPQPGNPDTCSFDLTFKPAPTDVPAVYSATLKLTVAGDIYTLSSHITATIIPAP